MSENFSYHYKYMFTLTQIQEAHKKVKTGADFPQYIRDIIVLGVTDIETSVTDGQTIYLGGAYPISSPALHNRLKISLNTDKGHFIERLRLHQSGGTDFLTFCQDCAVSGIEKWIIKTHEHTCTYYDSHGQEVLVEHFPM